MKHMKKNYSLSRSGFTLVEMLIVIGVLGVLISLLAPAILRNIKTAGDKKGANERKVLEAAIVEYWHDQGKWPIKDNDTPRKAAGYKLTYRDNNQEVFNHLIEADFGGRKKIKTYIDTGNHIVTATKESSYPSFTAMPLRDALKGSSTMNRPLVYWAEFIKCPHCPSSSESAAYSRITASSCQNNDCKYYKAEGKRYEFDPGDKKNAIRGLRPYNVTIDMLNNSVRVTE